MQRCSFLLTVLLALSAAACGTSSVEPEVEDVSSGDQDAATWTQPDASTVGMDAGSTELPDESLGVPDGGDDEEVVVPDPPDDPADAGEPPVTLDAGVLVPEPADAGETAPDAAVADAGAEPSQPDASVGTPPDEPDPPAPTAVVRTYRVLHWNIAGGKENACEPQKITRAVRRYVQDHDVDFVGLNEVCPAQFQAIKEALRGLWNKGPNVQFAAFVGDGTNRVVGNAIYSRHNLEGVTTHLLGHDQYGDRNLLCGRVPSRPHLRFCSTHLTPGDGSARQQLTTVLDRLEQWWTNRRDTVLLTGDLNLHANDSGLNAVYASAANTPNNGGNNGHYRELDDADPNNCRGYGERSLPNGGGGPCGTGGKIDFIFARANRIVDGDYAADAFAIPTDCTGACSDHRAIVGRAKLRIRLE